MRAETLEKKRLPEPLRRAKNGLEAALERHPAALTVALALLLTLAVEALNRHSLWQGAVFAALHPVRFAANLTIILVTLAVALFARKRAFFLLLISGVWLLLGVTNALVLTFRVMPFSVEDILLLPSVSDILTAYLEPWEIAVIALGILLALAGLILAFFRSKRHRRSWRLAALTLAASLAAAAGFYWLTAVGQEEVRRAAFSNFSTAYQEYGFVYCFCTGAVDRGIDRPEGYSQAAVEDLTARLERTPAPALRPNIVMVQLESFFDVAHLNGALCEEDPTPVFTALKEHYSSGFLTVPTVGAGTVNTEFEILSGMSLDFFGMGEYPYRTVLRRQACGSVVTDLKDLGYTAYAIHDNDATFYERDKVFPQLGFDAFTSIEYMEEVEYNSIGWARDRVLTREILRALDAGPGQEFVFAISVQGHGKYQRGAASMAPGEMLDVTWRGHEADSAALAYYCTQLREMDQFIGELVGALEDRGEPAVVVLYGDHLPAFNISADQLSNGDLFQTEYVIWDNLGLAQEDRDLSAFQLSAQVLGQLGIDGGVLSRYHQQCSGQADYADGLHLLEYDLLYGGAYALAGRAPYAPAQMRLGAEPIALTRARWDGGTLTVEGAHFTPWSRIAVDGRALETTFVSPGVLTASLDAPPAAGAEVTVRQESASSTNHVTLSQTPPLRWNG